jgi:short-subunit dehydrogenase
MTDLFRGTTALVTGASSGIGEVFARRLADAGANVVVTARSRDKLEALAGELAARHGVRVDVVVADLSEPDGAGELVRGVRALGGFVEHLVNNAGFGSVGKLASAEPERLSQMVRLNCEALVVLTREYLPEMIARRRGGVIQVASTAAYQPMPFMATYGATKAFVLSFSSAVAEELRGTDVRMLALCPGPVPTGFQEVAGIQPGAERVAALSAEDTVDQALEAYRRGKHVVVPGTVNRLQTTFSKHAPQGVVARAVAGAMRRMGRGE